MSATTSRRPGAGSVFRQEGRGRSRNWMLQFFQNGKRVIRSSKTTDKRKAIAMLQSLLGQAADGTPIDQLAGDRQRVYRWEDAAQAFDANLAIRGRRSRSNVAGVVARNLTPAFAGRRLDEITSDDCAAYARERLAAGAAPATVKKELVYLKRIFTLALQAGRIRVKPHVEVPKVDNARTGFFERAQFEAVCANLPAWFRGPARFAYCTGWRLASEVCALEWRNVDTVAGVVKIDTSKNGEGRTFPYRAWPELAAVIDEAARVRDERLQAGKIGALVFHDDDGVSLCNPSHPGLRSTIRREWVAACKAAGVPDRIPHDFRRTAVRNMVRAGIREKVAMELTGHKTREIFERYNIVDEHDLAASVALLAQPATRARRR